MRGMGTRASLLSGLSVLDLTGFLAGPYGSMILGDMGAAVTKVEPVMGDNTRGLGPYEFGGDSAYFLSINRNKQSISVDLKSAGGRSVIERLIRGSDVVLDNLRQRQREQLGLGYERIQQLNPQAISCSVTGFGSDGPYQDRAAYDMIVQALSGVMSLTGDEEGRSVRAGVPIGDLVAGMYVVIGVLGALEERHHSGHGQHIDIAMLDSQVSMLTYLASYYLIGGVVSGRQGRGHVSIPTYNSFATKDGIDLVVCANTEEMWMSLCRVLRRSDLIDDAKFRTNSDRLAHKEELIPILRAEIVDWPMDALYSALLEAGVPAAPIQTIAEVINDPQVLERDMVVTVPHRSGGTFDSLGSPIKCSRSVGGSFLPPPGHGEHTEAVLREIGFLDDEIVELVRSGAVLTN